MVGPSRVRRNLSMVVAVPLGSGAGFLRGRTLEWVHWCRSEWRQHVSLIWKMWLLVGVDATDVDCVRGARLFGRCWPWWRCRKKRLSREITKTLALSIACFLACFLGRG